MLTNSPSNDVKGCIPCFGNAAFDALIGQPEHASDFLADLVRILLDLGIDEFGIYLCGNDRLVA